MKIQMYKNKVQRQLHIVQHSFITQEETYRTKEYKAHDIKLNLTKQNSNM